MPLLTAIMILFRPRSIFQLTVSTAPAVVASDLAYRLFEAIELRDDTGYLGSVFAWYLLVAAIPQLASTRIPELRQQADTALNSIENVLKSLSSKRPSAANNLRNVRTLRKALHDSQHRQADQAQPSDLSPHAFGFSPLQLLTIFGPAVPKDFHIVESLLATPRTHSKPATLYAQMSNGAPAAADQPNEFSDTVEDPFQDLPPVVGSEWMQNWFEELELFGIDHPS